MTVAEADMAGLSEPCSVGLTSQSYDSALRENMLTPNSLVQRDDIGRKYRGTSTQPSYLPAGVAVRVPEHPQAMDAYWKEWHNLEGKNVFRYETLAEWDTVSRQARQAGREIHFGYPLRLHG